MNPEKLPLQSADGAQINLDMLYQIAPSCFTEARGADCKVRRVVNFDVLRQLLGDATAETGEELYQFTWPGKAEARREAARSIRKTLRPVPKDSVDWDTTQNLYIEGDNLEVLKLLQKSYMGKVKMIYIDPPYNTGNDFVYNDDFASTIADHDRAEGNTDELGNRYRKNTDSNGRFHSDWCSMIFPRLQVAKTLLSEDGAIFISIGEQELGNLIACCNEVFGSSNRLAIFNRVTKKSSNSGNNFSPCIDYVVIYAKNASAVPEYIVDMSEEIVARYNKTDEFVSERGPYQEVGLFMSALKHGGSNYPIECPDGSWAYPPNNQPWRWNEATFLKGKSEGRIVFKKTSTSPLLDRETGQRSQWNIYTKVYLNERAESGMHPKNFSEEFQNTLASNEIKQLKIPFDFAKPTVLLTFLIGLQCKNNDLILDFFSGSATTAHAVMKLNADDGGNRKFIMVQLPEKTEEDSEARKAGYENICEIGKERIRRAGRKIKEEAGLHGQDLDIGFRVFRVDESNMEDVYFQPAALRQQDLTSLFDNVKPDRTDLDLLFGAMLDWGVQLSLPMSKATIDGRDVYTVNEGDLMACFAENITENVIAHIADQSPLRVLFRDSCFNTDADKINIFEQFKQRLNWSDEEAMKNIRVI